MPPSFRPMPASASRAEPSGPALFADRIFTLLLASQIVLLAVALLFTPAVIDVLAPGFARDPERFALAVDLTRITFPYLLLITLVTLYGGILNALQRFAAAAAAPILLNLVDRRGAAAGRLLPDRRPCRGLGRADLRRAAGAAGRRRCLARRRACRAALARARRRRAAILPRARAGDGRLRRRAARAVRRHHHRELPAGRRAVGALLRRPHRSTPDRRHRHRRRHRHVAGNGAAASPPATKPAPPTRRTAPSNSRCCCRFRVSRPSSSSPN